MPSPEICIIAAMSENRVIGKDGKVPWRIPEDMKHFRELTTPHPIIMGRKTFESIGRPLPGRTNIVITRDESLYVNGCVVVHSLDAAIETAQLIDKERVFVMGGGQVYDQAIVIANRLFLTVLDSDFEGDTYFPDYSEFNKVIACQNGESDKYKYKFWELIRDRS